MAEPGNPNDLADRIFQLYRDRRLAARCGHNARDAALCFDRTRQVASYKKLFDTLVAAQRTRRALARLAGRATT